MELIMGCLLLLCFYCLSREAAAVSARMSQKKVIVVDCGHGGIDPGMIGIDGLKEKEFNLAIGMKLKKALEDYGYQVVMTRETDTGLYDEDSQNKKAQDMQKRILLIQKVDPVLTVSIHQNSYEDPAVKGPQVFYYRDSSKGKALAEILQDRFDYVLGDQNRRLPKANANYYLLLHVKCPIVIVECGFLSNRKEAALLNSGEYQDKLAYTIHMGIIEYLNKKQ